MTNDITEEEIIERIRDGLRDAVKGQNLSWERGTQVKKQKYVDVALNYYVGPIMSSERQQSPVTRSWYKYGCVQTVSTSRPDLPPRETPDREVNHESENQGEFEPPENILVPSEGTGVTPSEHDIAQMNATGFMQFFTETDLTPPLDEEHWAGMSNLKFLHPYYTQTAPSEFRDLYLANLTLRQVLGEAFETARLSERNRGALLTDSKEVDLDWTPDAYLRTAGQAAVELRLAIRGSPITPDSLVDPVMTYTDLIEDFLLFLTDVEMTDIRPQHYRTLKQLDEFLDGAIWEWIARYISYATVVGPQADSWRESSRDQIATFANSCPDEISALRKTIRDQGMLPSIKGYSTGPIEEDSAELMMSVIDEATIRNRTPESSSEENNE
jgi:hypothetical protein